ncbi:MAG: hypothetical protein KF844_00625 [Cryobacterium sp.]|nr:hypothetical protein [Cryobacterium sp.]
MGSGHVDRLRISLDYLAGIGPKSYMGSDAWGLALQAFESSWKLDHSVAMQFARRSIAQSGGEADHVILLSHAVLGLAAAGVGVDRDWTQISNGLTATGDALADALVLLGSLDNSDASNFAKFVFAEASLACARVSLSLGVSDLPTGFSGDLSGHPFEIVLTALAARVETFSGYTDAARSILARYENERAEHPGKAELDNSAGGIGLLVQATRCLVEGSASDVATVRALSERIRDFAPKSQDRAEVGIALLVAFGLSAIGAVRQANAILAGFNWEDSMIIDRVFVLDGLIRAAVKEGDVIAAEAWLERATPFENDPIANSSLERARARLAILRGDLVEAGFRAGNAIQLARAEGREFEALDAELLATQVLILEGNKGNASKRLNEVVANAGEKGFNSVRLGARAQLRSIGRRLKPYKGIGSAALSGRELEVLRLVLDGLETSEIANQLHISIHTARIHISRILASYSSASRIVLARRVVAEQGNPDLSTRVLSELTQQQRQVVTKIIEGLSVAEIAAELQIALRTVEKHITHSMRRLGVTTRVGLVLEAGGYDPTRNRIE